MQTYTYKGRAVDPGLLKAGHRVEYNRLVSNAELKKMRDAPRMWTALVIWAISLGLSMWALTVFNEPEPSSDPWLFVLLVVLFGGIGVIVWAGWHDVRAMRTRQVTEFLDRIDYMSLKESRNKRSTADLADGYEPLKSLRQRQHEWYGDHTELNWRDREMAESLGMDADTYASNFLND